MTEDKCTCKEAREVRKEMKTTLKLIALDEGDISVGITSTRIEIKFDGNVYFDKSMIDELCDSLKEVFEIQAVITAEEEIEWLDAEAKFLDHKEDE